MAIKQVVRSLDQKWTRNRITRGYNLGRAWSSMIINMPTLRRLETFRDAHIGERCFIAGNGPSIAQQDLTWLVDEFLFVTNDFPQHELYEEIAPTYYCASDPRFWKDGEPNAEWYELLLRKSERTVKFFPLRVKSIVEKQHLFSGHQVYYLNYSQLPIWETNSVSLDVVKWVHSGDSIIIDFCLPLAFYMGFQKIYLMGCDYDYGFDRAEDGSESYFFDIDAITHDRAPSAHSMGPWLNNVMTSFEIVKREFEKDGRRIYNAGLGGKLDVFDRVDYRSLV